MFDIIFLSWKMYNVCYFSDSISAKGSVANYERLEKMLY